MHPSLSLEAILVFFPLFGQRSFLKCHQIYLCTMTFFLGWSKYVSRIYFKKNSNNLYFRYKTKIASIISLKISVTLRKRGKIEVQKIKLLYIYMYYRVLCSNLEYWYSIKPQDQDANAIRLNRVTSHEKLHFLPETERNVVWVGWVGGGIAGVDGAVVIPDCCNSSD